MNTNRLENYFSGNASKVGSVESSHQTALPTIWVTGLYDSCVHRASATRCLAHVAQSVGTMGQVHSEWWSIEAFSDPASHVRAIESSRSSMMLWFAGNGCAEQIDLLQSWLAECRHTPGERRALVTFFDHQLLDPSTAICLHSIADRHELDLFCEPPPPICPWPVRKDPLLANELFGPARRFRRPPQIRGWGLNE